MKKIALEEHFLSPGQEEYFLRTLSSVPEPHKNFLLGKLRDFGEQRLAEMDKAGVEIAVLSLTGPGVHIEPDASRAIRNARTSNEFLAKEIAKRPDRYRGFAHLALQDGKEAAAELERCVNDYGFCGAMVDGSTNGMFMDDPSLNVLWEKVEELDAPIYLHPADPYRQPYALEGYEVLQRPVWGWGFETGSHALRLVFSGVFERFPKAKVILGHLGETLPFLLWRIDSRAIEFHKVKMSKAPSQIIRDNFILTNSGMCSLEPLRCSIDAMGLGAIMFSADHPFESMQVAADHIDTVAISEQERQAICWDNAWRHLGLGRRKVAN